MKNEATIKFFIFLAALVVLSVPAYASNLLTNGDFSTGTSSGWTVIQNGGSGATYTNVYATSYDWCSISQTVDLIDAGYTEEELDEAPPITFNISTMQRFDHDGYYYLEYKLLAEDGSTVIDSKLYGSVGSPIYLTPSTAWFETEYTFEDYGAGARYAYIRIAGQDGSPNWANQYGPYFDNASIAFADSQAPTLSALSPADGATGVTTDANLQITFSENVDAETGNIVIYKSSDNSLVETIDVTSDKVSVTDDTVTINPDAELDEQTSYYVQIAATAFDDAAGNSYAGISNSTTWNFTTGDFTNPTLLSFSPADGADSVSINPSLTLNFSEDVDAESGNITIYKSSDNSVIESISVTSNKVSGSGSSTIVVNPSTSFQKETSYYIQIAATAFDDESGNSYAGISNDGDWNFRTIESSGGGNIIRSLLKNRNTNNDNSVSLEVDNKSKPGSYISQIKKVFPDVSESHRNYLAVKKLRDDKIVSGYKDGNFKPENQVSRAEFTKIAVMAAAEDFDKNSYANCFNDVSDQWFAPYVCFAKEKGWVTGYGDETFRPESNINKVEVLAILFRIEKIDYKEIALAGSYTDLPENSWYHGIPQKALYLGLVEDAEFFSPEYKINRGEAAEFVYRLFY